MLNFAQHSRKKIDASIGREKGFTLIEVLVATAILAFSSLLVYNVILSSFGINRKLTAESDSLLTLSTATQSIERDIGQMYSPQIGQTTPPPDNTPEKFWSAIQREDGMRRMRFTGTKEKMTFISASNRRLIMESKETELAKITYKIVQEKDGTYSLVRGADIDVFNYEDRTQNENEIGEFKILEKLTAAHFSYYRFDKERWEEQWDSEAPYTEDASRYPSIIAIDIQYPSTDNETAILKWHSEFSPILKLNGETKPSSGVLK